MGDRLRMNGKSCACGAALAGEANANAPMASEAKATARERANAFRLSIGRPLFVALWRRLFGVLGR